MLVGCAESCQWSKGGGYRQPSEGGCCFKHWAHDGGVLRSDGRGARRDTPGRTPPEPVMFRGRNPDMADEAVWHFVHTVCPGSPLDGTASAECGKSRQVPARRRGGATAHTSGQTVWGGEGTYEAHAIDVDLVVGVVVVVAGGDVLDEVGGCEGGNLSDHVCTAPSTPRWPSAQL